MATATIDFSTSPTNTIKPPQHKRRDTESSNISEDDIAALRSAEIEIDGESKSNSTTATPSFAITSETHSRPSESSKATNTSSKASGGGVSMSSLRSLLGIPSNPSTTSTSGQTSQKVPSTGGLAPPGGKPSTSFLGVPPSTTARTAPQGIGGASGARIGSKSSLTINGGEDGREMIQSEIAPKRKKVILEPGCSALDWARRKQEILTERMKGGPEVMRMKRITKEELKKHNTTEDAWSAFQGKVYDLTPYLKFHPGGKQELMRVAGRDGTRLFMLTHSWVNIDAMIDACCIGVLVSDS